MATSREPILNIPGAMTALVGLLVAIHLFRLALPVESDETIIWTFGFVPARYDATLLAFPIPGGAGAKVWSFVTYALLHADWGHLAFNILWFLPFGSALARRLSVLRFLGLMIVSAVAGAGAHLLTHAHEIAPMIGASAMVSGAMGAALRFAFERGSFLSFRRRRDDADAAAQVPAVSLVKAFSNPQVLAFLAVWFGINIVFGIGSIAIGTQAQSIAWQAHIGGFLAGLLLFSLFDPVPRAGQTYRVPSDAGDRDGLA